VLGTIAIADEGWYRSYAEHSEVTELNFWTPEPRCFRRTDPTTDIKCQDLSFSATSQASYLSINLTPLTV
jgi:hypothetical protein